MATTNKKLSYAKAMNAVSGLNSVLEGTGHGPRLSDADRAELEHAKQTCDTLARRLFADERAARVQA